MPSDPLLQPYQLKTLRLRNRIMTTAHEPAYSESGMPTERYRAYHVERAKAGVALTMTAGSASVSRDSPPVFSNLLLWKDEVVPWLRQMADEIHENGAAIMIQLSHLGRRTRYDKADWLPVVSASMEREAAHRAFPKQVEAWDLKRIVSDYADAAERVYAAGLDGLELQAYGHLMDQFWSPLTNTLPPPYGGSLENRLRLTFDILSEIRKRTSPDFIIGVRYTADEQLPGGIDAAEGIDISLRLRDSGLIDFLNVVRGHIDTDAGLTDLIPIQGMPSAPHLEFAGAIRAATGFPTFHAAKIQDVATARYAIASGQVDMIGMTRAHMADPHIVRKIMDGHEERIRPCVGANYCLDRIYQGGAAYCIHNPATGRELSEPHAIEPTPSRKRVVVVGAGVAGLEAARVAAERGHDVTVLEASSLAGGQVGLITQSERRKEMVQVVDWRITECERLGVEFRFNVWAEAETVLRLDAQVVVIATGGLPHTEVLGSGNELVKSAWDIIAGDVKPGRAVLLYDDAGDYTALQAAEIIAASGADLEIMTPDRTFSPEIMGMNLVPYMRTLQRENVTFTVTYRLKDVECAGSQLRAKVNSDYGRVDMTRVVDQVIVNHGTRPLAELYFELQPLSRNGGAVDYKCLIDGVTQPSDPRTSGTFDLFRVGDAIASRNIHAAIYDSLRLAKTF